MNKKVKFSLIALAMAGAIATLAACGEKDPGKKPGGSNHGTVTPNTEVRYTADGRAEAYGYFAANGTKKASFKDMYKAIEQCVEEGDEGDYVAKLSGDDADVKLFVMKNAYADNNTDQFFYYENGTSLDRYSCWTTDYHEDLKKNSKNDIGVMKGLNGLQTYRQGYELVGLGDTGGTLATWNVYPFSDANVQVDFAPYDGITKVEYDLKLTEAKIYPSYEGYDDAVYSQIGFLFADAYLVAHFGFAFDNNTGNMYYYKGIAEGDVMYDGYDETKNIGMQYDTENCYLTSTWNEEGGYYVPTSDIKMTAESVPLTDDDGETYYVYRLTAEFDDGSVLVKDWEHASMTSCATHRFNASLNIINEEGMPAYGNGAQFQNLKITSAKGTIKQESIDDPTTYGGNLITHEAGVYDLLNSNEATDVRFQTVIYNRAAVSYNFDTPNCDIYNFSFRFDNTAPAYSSAIRGVKEAIAEIPAIDKLTKEDKATVDAAVNAFNKLTKPYQTDYITDAEKKTLDDAEKRMAALNMSGGASAVEQAVKAFKEIGFGEDNYSTAAALKLDSAKIHAAWAAYQELSDKDKEALETMGVTQKLTALEKALTAIEKANSKLGDLLDYTVKCYNTEGEKKDDKGVVTKMAWDIAEPQDGIGTNLYKFYKAYTGCTAEEIASLPANILAVINSEYVQNFIKDAYLYARTLAVVNGWYTKLGWELPSMTWVGGEIQFTSDYVYKTANGWYFKEGTKYTLTDELFAKIPEVEIAELAGLWSAAATPNNNTWALRFNAYAIDELLRGECGASDRNYQIMALFYAVLDYKADDDYTFDAKPAEPEEGKEYTRRVISNMGEAINAVKFLANVKDHETIAGICDLDNASAMKKLIAAYDKLNAAEKEALKKFPGGEHAEWAVTSYLGEHAKMESVKEKVAALDKTAADFEAKLDEVVAIYQTFQGATGYFFRASDSQWLSPDAPFQSGAYVESWTKLKALIDESAKWTYNEGTGAIELATAE